MSHRCVSVIRWISCFLFSCEVRLPRSFDCIAWCLCWWGVICRSLFVDILRLWKFFADLRLCMDWSIFCRLLNKKKINSYNSSQRLCTHGSWVIGNLSPAYILYYITSSVKIFERRVSYPNLCLSRLIAQNYMPNRRSKPRWYKTSREQKSISPISSLP